MRTPNKLISENELANNKSLGFVLTMRNRERARERWERAAAATTVEHCNRIRNTCRTLNTNHRRPLNSNSVLWIEQARTIPLPCISLKSLSLAFANRSDSYTGLCLCVYSLCKAEQTFSSILICCKLCAAAAATTTVMATASVSLIRKLLKFVTRTHDIICIKPK